MVLILISYLVQSWKMFSYDQSIGNSSLALIENIPKLKKIKAKEFWGNWQDPLRVRLVGGMRKWEDRKWQEDGKVGGSKDFNFPTFCLVESGKVEGWKK